MTPVEPSRRKQVVVDPSLQLAPLKLWVLLGVFVAAAAAAVVLLPYHLRHQPVPPNTLHLLIGMCVFMLLMCLLMGVVSIAQMHRVAGAAFKLRGFVARLAEGRYAETVTLRRDDHLQDFAESLNALAADLAMRRGDLAAGLESIKTSAALTDAQRAQVQKLLDALKEPAPSNVEGPAPSNVEGPAPSNVEGPAPGNVEGPAPSKVEGPPVA